MKKVHSVEDYIESQPHYAEALELLRSIILSTELEETIKWSAPVYTLKNKNVLSIGAFKNHFGVWFFNGVFLKDPKKLLKNAQDGKTKAMRQMRFETINDINKQTVLAYIKEAIENQKLGKELKPDRSKKETIIPKELQEALDSNPELKSGFDSLSNYKQREYCEYIDSAKREATKQSRLQKIEPMILKNIGLNDKYKNH
ncbi:DUF1801 domain-containing protein [Tamlana sp. 2201CG12-4]|uniref:YdeI/OmpD-associated family protein n=1 Tax=Tamlana sp. 2201CG12-4 TaxID=3112582 RepID=UPI002DB8FA1A|nr:DUF1801 domain-containing protein [Tamlana sp. 2201CG12-4]MEC3907387.1 DUF1801 domain-containing protein [Tamlana sp. 2201CG12-4]